MRNFFSPTTVCFCNTFMYIAQWYQSFIFKRCILQSLTAFNTVKLQQIYSFLSPPLSVALRPAAFSQLLKKVSSLPLLAERFQMRLAEYLFINMCLMLFPPAFSWQLFVSFSHSTATEVILLITCKVSKAELWHCVRVCVRALLICVPLTY